MERVWFRSSAWDETARADFEVRLKRSRDHNRQQYLRIKGLSLLEAGKTDAAGELLQRAADYPRPPGYLLQAVGAWEKLGDIAVERGDYLTAEQLYRRILAESPTGSGTTGTVKISLAAVLVDIGREEDRDEILGLLSDWLEHDQIRFSNVLFRWHLVLLRVADVMGDHDTVQRAARNALALSECGPQLPRHPDIGVVKADDSTIAWLRELAR